ncbi:Hypothetical predicted protein, partial [Lynx pardinus]
PWEVTEWRGLKGASCQNTEAIELQDSQPPAPSPHPASFLQNLIRGLEGSDSPATSCAEFGATALTLPPARRC